MRIRSTGSQQQHALMGDVLALLRSAFGAVGPQAYAAVEERLMAASG